MNPEMRLIEKKWGNKSGNFFVLAGVMVENASDTEISAYMSHIKRRYGLSDTEFLHAVALFEGKRRKKNQKLSPIKMKPISPKKATQISASIAEFLATFPIHIKIVALNKNKLRKALKVPSNYAFKGSKEHKEDKEVGYEILARELFFWFARYLKNRKAMGRIVGESRQHPDLIVFRTYLQSREKNTFKEKTLLWKWAESMKNHITAIGFENKKGIQGGLEIADLSSYLAHLHLRNEMLKFQNRGTKIIWKVLSKKIENKKINLIEGSGFNRVAFDRIHKITKTIKERWENVYNKS